MPKVVSVTFAGNNKRYYFAPIEDLKKDEKVVVETIRGLEIGTITEEEKDIEDSEVIGDLKSVKRKAEEKDLEDYKRNLSEKPDILEKTKKIISEYKLDMKLLDAEYTLDRSKLTIYFSSEGRVDFRELVKELAYVYRTRIELRQVGPRDASRIVSGIGMCGREVCCSSFLGDIQNVTIKMAKNQNLALNPNSISGLCGKLLCCISYEDQSYQSLKEKMPQKGDNVKTEKGYCVVQNVDLFSETVTVRYKDNSVDVVSFLDIIEKPEKENGRD